MSELLALAERKSMIWPVFEFRPADGYFRGPTLRYAEGKWLPDDGEYDICFIGTWGRENYSLFFEPPNHKNIICSWLTGHWTGSVQEHPRANPWHYALREGQTEWGDTWGRDKHPNLRAGDAGMNEVCAKFRSASGRHIEMKPDDKHIAAGLLRNRETKEIFRFPDHLTCMYCAAKAPIRCTALTESPPK